MSRETGAIAEFTVGLKTASIPAAVKERMRDFVVDSLAAGYIGIHQQSYQRSILAMQALGGSGGRPVFGCADTFDLAQASFLNGVAIGCFEADHISGGAHPGGCVFPAVFALASSLGSSGEDLLRALVVGYEVNCRVARAQTNAAEHDRGFHNPGISGPFGAAAAVASLMGFSLDQTLSALGIAGSHAAGLIEYVWTGAMTKRIHEGRAAQLGLESALLAQHGVTGPPTIFEGPFGYLQAYSPSPEPNRLVEGLGSSWALDDIRVKPYAGHGTAQPFIGVLGEWRKKGVDPTEITRIDVRTSAQGTEERFHDLNPNSVLGIQYSLPFMIAIALAKGVEGCLHVDERILDDEVVRNLAGRIHFEEGEGYRGNVIVAGGDLTIWMGDEQVHLEAPSIPSHGLDELGLLTRNKLRLYSEGIRTENQVNAILDAVDGIEGLESVATLEELVFH